VLSLSKYSNITQPTFGSAIESRAFASGEYRYGFGGHEKDDEVKGSGNHYSFADYGYDPRLGRRWQIDPKTHKYPWISPYATFNNNPIFFVDINGEDPNPHEVLMIAKWGLFVTFRVKKAADVALETAQNSGLSGLWDGEGDAFRHAFWNALMVQKVGAWAANDFATAHESGSGAADPKSDEYDPVAVEMDLFNNQKGREIAKEVLKANPKATEQDLADAVESARDKGELKVMKTGVFDIGGRKMEIAVNKAGNPVIAKGNKGLIDAFKKEGITVDTNTKNKVLVKSGSSGSSGTPSVDY
jgi:RHS repeat-associated protein